MFRRFILPHCKSLKTLCMFLIILQYSKSGVASSCCCQIWDGCGNTFFTCWSRLADLETNFSVFFPMKSTSEASQRVKMQFSPIHIQRGGGISFWIFSDQFEGIPSHFSVFFTLKSTSVVLQRLKMQFSPIHFQWLVWQNSNAGGPSACKKRFTTQISNLAAPATGNSTFIRLKYDEKHT